MLVPSGAEAPTSSAARKATSPSGFQQYAGRWGEDSPLQSQPLELGRIAAELVSALRRLLYVLLRVSIRFSSAFVRAWQATTRAIQFVNPSGWKPHLDVLAPLAPAQPLGLRLNSVAPTITKNLPSQIKSSFSGTRRRSAPVSPMSGTRSQPI